MQIIYCVRCKNQTISEPGFYCTDCKIVLQQQKVAFDSAHVNHCDLDDSPCIDCIKAEAVGEVIIKCNNCKKTHRFYRFFRWLPKWLPEPFIFFCSRHPFLSGYAIGLFVEFIIIEIARLF